MYEVFIGDARAFYRWRGRVAKREAKKAEDQRLMQAIRM